MWVSDVSLQELCDLRKRLISDDDTTTAVVGLCLFYASWNKMKATAADLLTSLISEATNGLQCKTFATSIQIDATNDSLDLCIGDNGTANEPRVPLPPGEMPALVLVAQNPSMEHSRMRYISGVDPATLLRMSESLQDSTSISEAIARTIQGLESDLDLRVKPEACNQAVRIFVAGDRSSVGKSSMCLGILGNLLRLGYDPSSLAYIKPATQSESTQLIQLFCEKHNVHCVPIGPVVRISLFLLLSWE